MLTHKLVLDEIEEDFFKLIALHCSIEEYRLAFLLNKHLHLKLARTRTDLDYAFGSVRAEFPLYEYFDAPRHCRYYLIANKASVQAVRECEAIGSFEGENWDSKSFYLLPEFQNVDYFLKIEEEGNSISHRLLLESLKEIPQLATAYLVDDKKIKATDNLIFD